MSRRYIAGCHEHPSDMSLTTYRYHMSRTICRGQCERRLISILMSSKNTAYALANISMMKQLLAIVLALIQVFPTGFAFGDRTSGALSIS